MRADRKWVRRNLGFDPVAEPPPPGTFAVASAAKASATAQDIQREIIDFDSDGPSGKEFMAFSTATGLSRYTEIEWPAGLAPETGTKPAGRAGGRLPKANVLVVTWTVDEGHALSRVLTPGKDSRNDYLPYKRNFAALAKKMQAGCPALQAHRLGTYWTTRIGGQSVVVFKSDSHLSQDGPQIPNLDVWAQIIDDVQPRLVITTGTGGGIGTTCEVGDVVVSPIVRFDCTTKFKSRDFATAVYRSSAVSSGHFAAARSLFKFNAARLPPDNARPPKIVKASVNALPSSVVTTDFFGIDTSANTFKLKGLGAVCEMGDAVLGLVVDQAKQAGATVPRWVAVRNVSDPQISSVGTTLKEQINLAAVIYKGFGRWSSVCSAIVCWAIIAAEDTEAGHGG